MVPFLPAGVDDEEWPNTFTCIYHLELKWQSLQDLVHSVELILHDSQAQTHTKFKKKHSVIFALYGNA